MLKLALTLLLTTIATAQTCSNRQTPTQIDARIDTLIAQLTPAERIAQLGDRAPAIPRLNLPAYNWWNEGLHGVARNGYATVFPQAIGLAATFDPQLLHAVGDTISTEARAKFHPHADSPRYGGLTLWSPNINIFRDPRWGRGQETYGEDPYLTATLGTQFVEGIQGNDPFYLKADATPKHFVAHSGPEQGRDSFHANATPHDLADTYLPAFHALTSISAALMCSYNAIDDTPSCANNLLQQTVRDAWHFNGYIVSDCDAVGNLTEYQHYTTDAAHAAAAALNAGVDLDCGNTYNALNLALAQHLVTQATINRSLHRLLLARLHLGLLDPGSCSPYSAITAGDNDTPAHRALALRAAEESIVLLYNGAESHALKVSPAFKGTGFSPYGNTPQESGALALEGTATQRPLPLKPNEHIAILGPNADSLKILEANYHGTASHPITPLDGLLAAFPNATYAQGSLLAEGIPALIPRTALRSSTEPNAPQGLRAEYFDNPNFTGIPITTTVPNIDLDLDRVSPTPQLTTEVYSARWTGVFVPPAPGDYTLRINLERCWDCTTHDHFRLFLDGQLALDNDGTKAEPNTFNLHTTNTAPHTLRLELAHTGQDEGIALEWLPPASALLDEAVRSAQNADVLIAFVGLSPDLEGEALQLHLDGFNGGDRTSLALPAAQITLLHRLQQLHKKLVLVLNSGSAVALDPSDYNADALLQAWYPGEEGGTALANILSGRTNPSGRLPVTLYRSVADLPPFDDYSMAHRTYRYFTGPVLFPFGFGLSYTHFTYSQLHIAHNIVTATVRNTGTTAGADVAELYLVPPNLPGAPNRALCGIRRIFLQPGQSQTLTFTLVPTQLSLVDPAGHRAVKPGTYRLTLGTQTTTFQLSAHRKPVKPSNR